MVALGEHRHDGKAAAAVLARLDNLLPAQAISTTDYAMKKRKIRGPTGDPIDWKLSLTPYAKGIQDALDIPEVKVVGVQGPARWAKTVAAENKVMKHWTHGPRYNVLWYMQSEDDLDDYVDERFEWMLENHDEVAEQIDWIDPKNGRKRRMIGDALLLMRPATPGTTRGKAAPIIIADEIDAYQKRVRNGIMTLINNRQREFGQNAIAYICSHPDAGDEGIAGIIKDGLKHLWWWNCPLCKHPSSPCQGAEFRMVWNVAELLKKAEDYDRLDLLKMIQNKARLVCPHCRGHISERQRLPMSNRGHWLQPQQKLGIDGKVYGEQQTEEIMGFIGHAFMSPFVKTGALAKNWASAWITAQGGDEIKLKEETCKSLGEVYAGAKDDEKIDDWKTVSTRLTAPYPMRVVPPGVLFLTAFVDVQGDRFPVAVIGWDRNMQSWLIDRFDIKEWPGFESIDPTNRLRDWDIIERAVLDQVYPTRVSIDAGAPLYLPIAKTLINAAGAAGEETTVTNNARVWMANLTDSMRVDRMLVENDPDRPARLPVEGWRVQLFVGSRSEKSALYGKPYQLMVDDSGKALATPVHERAINVFQLKRVVAKRMKIEVSGQAGRMYLPYGLKPRYVRELVAEQFVNGMWVATGRNELWDGWVACEAARALLQPERAALWVETPWWATPRPKEEFVTHVDGSGLAGYYDRLAEINIG
jgi:phage terminase large subunit GpA-like protein